ncbi:MAG: ComEC/Rec2 family competence protein [Limisphaerales bacterium]
MFPAHSFRSRLLVFALFGVLGWGTPPAAWAGPKDGTLDVYWVDSEGGGSTLIVTPEGESVLIDAGNPGGRDPGRILRVARDVAGLDRIDHMIVTHFHIDHFGGVAELSALLPIANLWDNGLPDADPDGRTPSTWPLTSRPYREAKVGERRVVTPGTSVPLRGGATPVSLRCLIARQATWTPPDGVRRKPEATEAPPEKMKDTSDNANSSAWLLTFGGFRFYVGGDLTWNAEARLIWPEILVPEVDLYQVVHHGFDTSNHPRLVQALNPIVSVMNNGSTKGTSGEVLATLRGLPALKAQFQVHKNVRPDGSTNNCPDDCIANLERECAGHYVHGSVSPGGGKFTIVPRPGATARTFETRGGSRTPATQGTPSSKAR